MSKDHLIALLNTTASLGRIDLQDALLVWRELANKPPPTDSTTTLDVATTVPKPKPTPTPAPPTTTVTSNNNENDENDEASDSDSSEPAPEPTSKSPGLALKSRAADAAHTSESDSSDSEREREQHVDRSLWSVDAFDQQSLAFQESMMNLALDDAASGANLLFELAGDGSEALDVDMNEFDDACQALVEAINLTIGDAASLLDDPEDQDSVAHFTESFEAMQQRIVALRSLLAPQNTSSDGTPAPPPPLPPGSGIHGFSVTNVKVCVWRYRSTTSVQSLAKPCSVQNCETKAIFRVL
jgi:hypothetical protein